MTTAPAAAAPIRSEIYADDQICIERYASGTRRGTLVITFDPILHGCDERPYGYTLISKLPVDMLAVRKRSENFYQPLSRERFIALVEPIAARYTRVVVYGSSLGAYCALYFGGGLDCQVVASSPRISIHPSYGVTHWQQRHAFAHERFDRLPPPRCRSLVIFDPKDAMDGPYLRGEVLPSFPGARVLMAPYSGHPSNYFLSEIGYIGPLMRAVIAGTEPPPFGRSGKGRSSTYLQVLAECCASRGKLSWAQALALRSSTLNPKSALALRTQARIHMLRREPELARAAADRAHQLNDRDETTKLLMIESYRQLGLESELRERLCERDLAALAPPPRKPAPVIQPWWVRAMRRVVTRAVRWVGQAPKGR